MGKLSFIPLPRSEPDRAQPRPGDAAGESFDDLFRTYAPRVKALAERRLAARHVADDVVQETFIRALRAWHTLDPSRPVWPWLKTVANNVCIDMMRSHQRVQTHGSLDDVSEVAEADARFDAVELHLASQRRVGITTALAAVNARQRRVLVRKDIEGWATEEVAEFEGMTVDAVKSTLKRGRQTFRTRYLAFATENGLLGALLLLGSTAAAIAKRGAARLRDTGVVRLAGAVPVAHVVPMAVILSLTCGVIALERGNGDATRTTALPPSSSLASLRHDPLGVAATDARGDGPGSSASGPARSTTKSMLSAPVPPGQGMAVGAGVAREGERTLISVEASIAGEAPGLDLEGGTEIAVTCKEGVRASACDAVDAAWAVATAP